MTRVSLTLALVLTLVACGQSSEVRGVVLDVEGDLTSVSSFTLRTDGGDVITVIPSDEGDFEFPLAHLNDHRSTLTPIIVELDRSVDPPLALAIRDADPHE